MAEIPENVKKGLKIVYIENADEAIDVALERRPDPSDWVEPEEPVVAIAGDDASNDEVMKH